MNLAESVYNIYIDIFSKVYLQKRFDKLFTLNYETKKAGFDMLITLNGK